MVMQHFPKWSRCSTNRTTSTQLEQARTSAEKGYNGVDHRPDLEALPAPGPAYEPSSKHCPFVTRAAFTSCFFRCVEWGVEHEVCRTKSASQCETPQRGELREASATIGNLGADFPMGTQHAGDGEQCAQHTNARWPQRELAS
jgi:hypothetical protein